MRNPNRFDDFYGELKEIHKTCFPDWRFGQLITNFEFWVSKKKGKVDIFYIEDDEMAKYLKEFVECYK